MILQLSRTAKRALKRGVAALACVLCVIGAIATTLAQGKDGMNPVAQAALPFSARAAEIVSYPLQCIESAKEVIAAWTSRRREYNRVLAENAELRSLLAREKLRHYDYLRLKALMDYQDIYPYAYLSARAVGMLDRGPSERALVLIDEERLPQDKGPFAVINALGLVGRTVGYEKGAASVMLLSDVNSRVPVTVGGKFRRAIMAGTNEKYPRLEFIGEEHGVRAGDYVMTSGDGGIFPPDLFVGRVGANEDGRFYVKPYVKPSLLRHVSIIVGDKSEK